MSSSNIVNKVAASADCGQKHFQDTAKITYGLQSDGISSAAISTNAWNSCGTTLTDANKVTVKGTLSTRSYDDVDAEIATRPTFDDVKTMIKEVMTNKEKQEMKGFNFDFGPCTDNNVRLSMYGIAVKNASGNYVSYNPGTGDIVDVDLLNFNGGKFMYKIPVAFKDIKPGDVVIHNRKPMIVVSLPEETVKTDKSIEVIDVASGEDKFIIPTSSPFGFNFMTKVVSLFDMGGMVTPSPDQPFGNMLPFLMCDDDKEIDPMAMMLLMGGKMDMSNPMTMYFMLKGDKSDNLIPLMFMMQGNK